MEITLDIDSILDYIYADSAIGAILATTDPRKSVPLLTPDHRHGLRRTVAVAAAALAATSGGFRIAAAHIPPAGDDSKATLSLRTPGQTNEEEKEEVARQLAYAVTLKTLAVLAARAGHSSQSARLELEADEAAVSPAGNRPFAHRLDPA